MPVPVDSDDYDEDDYNELVPPQDPNTLFPAPPGPPFDPNAPLTGQPPFDPNQPAFAGYSTAPAPGAPATPDALAGPAPAPLPAFPPPVDLSTAYE